MKNWKRALLYIRRKRGKSLMLFCIMWVCLSGVLIAGCIRNQAGNVTMQLKEKLSGYFTVAPNRNVEGASRRLNREFCEEVMEDENLLAYNGTDVYYMSLPDLTLTPGSFSAIGQENEAHAARFVSSTDSARNEQFYLGELELTEGEHIKAGDEGMALISETLAEDNGLKIGDTFTSVVTEGYQGPNDRAIGEKFTYQVKGIYHVKNPADGDAQRAECDIQNNYIFVDERTDWNVLSLLLEEETDWYRYGVNFYIRDSERFDETYQRVQEKMGLSQDAYRFEQNNGKYQQSAEPLERITKVMGIFIAVVIILSAAILCLILLMWMKDRKREVGIYLSAGIGKREILTQLLMESLLLYLVAAVAAGLCAKAVMAGVGRLMLSGELIGMAGISELGLGGAEMLATTAGGCVIVLAAVLVSFLSVVRMSPREILVTNE